MAGESNLEEIGPSYTFFWPGVPEGEKHQAGVGFAIKTSTLCQFEFLLKGIDSRLMSLHVSLSHDRYATLNYQFLYTDSYGFR